MMIRAEQMDALRVFSDETFAVKATVRLRALFPKHVAFMGDEALSGLLRTGIPRARNFGFRSERGIQTYLSLMVYFGTEFQRDPQYTWILALLEESPAAQQEERARIDRIIEATGEYSVAVAGPNREHVDRALACLIDHGRMLIADPPRPITLPSVQLLLTEVYPEKAGRLGEAGLTGLVQNAHATARRHELPGAEPVILFSVLSLLLGTFAAEDPQFAWIGQAISECRRQLEPARLQHLLDRSFERLAAWAEK